MQVGCFGTGDQGVGMWVGAAREGGLARGSLIKVIEAGDQNHEREVSTQPRSQTPSSTPSPQNTAMQTLATWAFKAALGHNGQKADNPVSAIGQMDEAMVAEPHDRGAVCPAANSVAPTQADVMVSERSRHKRPHVIQSHLHEISRTGKSRKKVD